MITVKLYGHLGKRFGRMHRFDIKSPAEAIRALRANFKDFGQYLTRYSQPGYRVIAESGDRTAEQLQDPIGGNVLKIVPYVAGAGNGVGQFILGAVLVVAGFYTGQSYLMNIGAALMLGGVSQMLFTPPTPPEPGAPPTNAPSYSFNGAVNTTNQGNPVPVCYGRMIVGSQVISGGMHAAAI